MTEIVQLEHLLKLKTPFEKIVLMLKDLYIRDMHLKKDAINVLLPCLSVQIMNTLNILTDKFVSLGDV